MHVKKLRKSRKAHEPGNRIGPERWLGLGARSERVRRRGHWHGLAQCAQPYKWYTPGGLSRALVLYTTFYGFMLASAYFWGVGLRKSVVRFGLFQLAHPSKGQAFADRQ